MARPKSNIPNKQTLHLTVSKETKILLYQLSVNYNLSISELVEMLSVKELKRFNRRIRNNIKVGK